MEFGALVERLAAPLPGYLGRGFLEKLGADLASAREADPARFEAELAPALAAKELPDPLPLEGLDAVVAWDAISDGRTYSLGFGGPQPADLFDRLTATGAIERVVAIGFVGSAEEGTAISDELLVGLAGCDGLTGLRQLSLRGQTYRGEPSELDGSGLRALAASPLVETVTSLWVDDLAAPRDVLIDWLASWRALTWLKLHRMQLTGDELGALVAAKAWPELESLEISACSIGDAGAAHIANAGWKLTALYLPHSKIEGPGVEALAASEHLAGLTTLEMSRCWLRDAGAIAIAESGWKLTALDLVGCQVRDAGFAALARAPFIGDLIELRLANNKPWPEGVLALLDSPLAQVLKRDIEYEYEDL